MTFSLCEYRVDYGQYYLRGHHGLIREGCERSSFIEQLSVDELMLTSPRALFVIFPGAPDSAAQLGERSDLSMPVDPYRNLPVMYSVRSSSYGTSIQIHQFFFLSPFNLVDNPFSSAKSLFIVGHRY